MRTESEQLERRKGGELGGPSSAILERRAAARRRLLIQRRRAIALVVLSGVVVTGLAAIVSALSSGGQPARHRAADAAVLGGARRLLPAKKLAAGEDRAINRVLAYTPFVSRGGARHHEIALTFDDGPGPYTLKVVHTLRKLHVPATFFQVGVMIPTFRKAGMTVRRYFPVGDHTVSHAPLGRLPKSRQMAEILGDVPRLRVERVPTPRLFRPPYASFDRDTLAVLRGVRMLMVLWTIDSQDYLRPGTNVIVQRVLSQAKPGAIVLMHDAGGDRSQTLAALPTIVHKLHKRHYRFVTVPRMLADAPPPHHQPLPPGAESGRRG